jgi:S-adenosylmethionine hydrolase
MDAILLFTDYGAGNLYVGQLHYLASRAGLVAVDLAHDAPKFSPRCSGRLLYATLKRLDAEGGRVVAVVDPGVGGERGGVRLRWRGWELVGPNNGLFGDFAWEAQEVIELDPSRFDCSDSFHGRDWFLPVAIELAKGIEEDQRRLTPEELIGKDDATADRTIIYVDGFGNMITGLEATRINEDQTVTIANREISFARTFCSTTEGRLFWYRNSIGLLEIAANRGNAAAILGCGVGEAFSIE